MQRSQLLMSSSSAALAFSPNDAVRVGCIGIHAQGGARNRSYNAMKNVEIDEGAISTTLVHLNNIRCRHGHTLHFDPTTCSTPGGKVANAVPKKV